MVPSLGRASRRVEEGLSRSFSGGGVKPSCPSPSAGDLRELPRVPLRGEGSCGGGGGPRDSAGSGATDILMEQVRNDHLYCYQGFLQIKMNFFTKWMIEHRWAKECQMIPNDNKVVN